ncbi:MATE family efflux transporter [Oceanicella actignis]|uniref:Multidrug resistance protein, MATE family n=1 Tax=Oceanicella actignis TaxID=1189325 RepID=A0A1M7SVG1_9RHOB|nr:MATE family efflux transporter [Oceanicella actignis]SES72290.1 multidrug resistance protein, MATE family [Oceanicella actignis]SHN62390.1 multidrug resistance protein, MATE family [Oceanicella actignis]
MSAACGVAGAPIGHRRILRIATPIMLSNATVPLLGAVDTAAVGQMGAAAPIGAVGLGAAAIGLAYWAFGFLRMGTTGLAAQARGAGDEAESGAVLARGLLIALCAGAAIVLLGGAIVALTLALSPASAEVEAMTADYLSLRLWGAPAAISVYALTGWLIAAERTRAVLALQLWMNGLNAALDAWFVLGLGWGVSGVAAATLAAELSGAALGLWLCRSAFAALWRGAAARAGAGARAGRRAMALVLDRARLRRMAGVNADILVRSVLLEAGLAFFVFRSAAAGDAALAANQVLLQFLMICAYALDGFAFAAEALVGQAFGARDPAALRRAAMLSARWGLGCAAALSGAFALGGGAAIDLMAAAPEVRLTAREFLPWVVALPLAGLPAWMLDGVFIGATRTRDMRVAMMQSVPVYALAWAALTPLMGAHGLWAALTVFFAARGATLALRYPALERAAAGCESGGALTESSAGRCR